VGTLTRKETDELIIGYNFDLRNNTLTPETVPNPSAEREHIFHVWRLNSVSSEPVMMRKVATSINEADDESDNE
jgi:hypothetical protein